jgi:hypothetical protein
MTKQVSVFAPVGTLDHQTSILNAVRCFAAAGYQVDVYTVHNRQYPRPAFESPAVRVRYLPWTFNAEREPRTLVTLLFTAWILLTFWRIRPVIYAGGVRGLIAAYAYAIFRRVRIVNYQMELYVGDKLEGRGARLFKAVERRAAQRSEVSIEHSAERRAVMAADLGVPVERILIVPNAPIGPARPHESVFLHRRLGLQESTRLLLCPGTITEACRTSDVVRGARSLPAGWACAIHSAGRREESDPYIRQLRELAAGSPVSFSLEPVPYGQIDEVMGSARIGIALYASNIGPNWSTIGLASGKLSHFLRLGVPVIVSRLAGLEDFVLEHGVGEVLTDPDELGELVRRIEADAAGYRSRALRCFDTHLSYDRTFRQVIDVTDRWVREDQ